MYVWMHAWMDVCMYFSRHACMCTQVCVDVYMYAYMHAHACKVYRRFVKKVVHFTECVQLFVWFWIKVPSVL